MEGLSIKYIGEYFGTFLFMFVALFACLDVNIFLFGLSLIDEQKFISQKRRALIHD